MTKTITSPTIIETTSSIKNKQNNTIDEDISLKYSVQSTHIKLDMSKSINNINSKSKINNNMIELTTTTTNNNDISNHHQLDHIYKAEDKIDNKSQIKANNNIYPSEHHHIRNLISDNIIAQDINQYSKYNPMSNINNSSFIFNRTINNNGNNNIYDKNSISIFYPPNSDKLIANYNNINNTILSSVNYATNNKNIGDNCDSINNTFNNIYPYNNNPNIHHNKIPSNIHQHSNISNNLVASNFNFCEPLSVSENLSNNNHLFSLPNHYDGNILSNSYYPISNNFNKTTNIDNENYQKCTDVQIEQYPIDHSCKLSTNHNNNNNHHFPLNDKLPQYLIELRSNLPESHVSNHLNNYQQQCYNHDNKTHQITDNNKIHYGINNYNYPTFFNLQPTAVPLCDINRYKLMSNDPCNRSSSTFVSNITTTNEHITNGFNKNTHEGTKTAVRRLQRWYEEKYSESLNINEINSLVAPKMLEDFFNEIRDTRPGKVGNRYEPVTLTTYKNGLRRYFLTRSCPPAVENFDIAGHEFENINLAINCKQNIQKSNSKVTKWNLIDSIDNHAIINMCEIGVIGKKNPLQLIRTVWLMNTKQFGIKGRLAHHKVKVSDFHFITELDGHLSIRYSPPEDSDSQQPSSCSTPTQKNKKSKLPQIIQPNCSAHIFLINCFKLYLEKRPPGCESFYLTPKTNVISADVWYNKIPMGKNSIGRIMNDILAKNISK